jgi:DNA polymerase
MIDDYWSPPVGGEPPGWATETIPDYHALRAPAPPVTVVATEPFRLDFRALMPAPPPPSLDDLRAGATLVAGLGTATILPDFDFETYSEAGYVWDDEAEKWRGPPGAPKGSKGLEVVGARNYVDHPTIEILSLFYDLKDGKGRRQWRPGMPAPQDLLDYIASGGLIEAWNVGFECWVWEFVCVKLYGWPPLNRQHQVRCAMAKARAHALPGKLAETGKVLALAVQKDEDGKRLLDKFSVPRNPTKADPRRRLPPLWTPERAAAEHAALAAAGVKANAALARSITEQHVDTLKLGEYNATDIASEAEASSRIPDLTPHELRYWQDDQKINRRGVAIDLEGMHNCIAIVEQVLARYGEELIALTGCKTTEIAKLQGWLHALGVHLDSLDEDHVAEALKSTTLPPQARRALELRAAAGSASVKKVFAMRNTVSSEGRLHDLYSYHGARTGRPTGGGVQATNLAKAGPNVYRCGYMMVNGQDVPLPTGGCGRFHGAHTMWCHWCNRITVRGPKDKREWSPEAMEDALHAIGFRSIDWLEMLFGDALLTVAGVLRGLFVASPGRDLVSSDFTAIEGVIIACLAGEKWRIDAYANDEPMYLLSAERMFGTTVAEMKAYAKQNGHHHPLRQKGKGGELGLGFGGWIKALQNFDVDGPEDELKDTILKWRAASPSIEWLWGGQMKGKADAIRKNAGMVHGWVDTWDKTPEYFGLEGAAVQAVLEPGREVHVRRLTDDSLTGISYLMRGDVLYCRAPGDGLITYHRPRLQQPEQKWRGLSLSFEGWNSNPKAGAPGWIRMNTYSGKLAENVTQHVARNKQMGAIARCEDDEYPVVMHTYDEIVADVPEGEGSVVELEALMVKPDPWNEGWPIKAAGGWRGKRYRKG